MTVCSGVGAIAEYPAHFGRQKFLAPAVPQWLLNNASVLKYCYRSAVVESLSELNYCYRSAVVDEF